MKENLIFFRIKIELILFLSSAFAYPRNFLGAATFKAATLSIITLIKAVKKVTYLLYFIEFHNDFWIKKYFYF